MNQVRLLIDRTSDWPENPAQYAPEFTLQAGRGLSLRHALLGDVRVIIGNFASPLSAFIFDSAAYY